MKNKGFTLIELVIVIIVLAILAAVAAPKFLNLQTDARIATLEGAEAAVLSANEITYAKASILGINTTSGAVDTIDTVKGNIVMTEENLTKAMITDLNIVDMFEGPEHSNLYLTIDHDLKTIDEVSLSECYLMVENSYGDGSLYIYNETSGC